MSAATVATASTRSEPVVRKGFWRGMLWLTWRQHRWQLVAAAVVTAGLLIWMMMTASTLSAQVAKCGGVCGKSSTLDAVLTRPLSYANYQLNTVVTLPLVIGAFLGVPLLAREYEQRTLMLAWSQDISPLKWLWGKLAILGVAVGAMAAALAGESVHLAHVANLAGGKSLFEGTFFQAGGWLPLTLALAWFAFGVAVGTVLRRLLPALAVVLAAFVGRIVLMTQQRPNFMEPVHHLKSFAASAAPPPGAGLNDMSVGGGNGAFVDSAGGLHSLDQVFGQWCGGVPQGKDDTLLRNCLSQHDIIGEQISYHPASRMGTFHLIENGLNLSLLIVSLAVTWWFVRKARTTM